MLDLVVSTVVMVVTERKVRLVLKALLVRRVPRVSKVLLAHVENVVKMVMTEQPAQSVHVERQVLKVSQAKMAKQASVVNAGCLVMMGQTVVMVEKVLLVLLVPMEKLVATVPLGLSVGRVVMACKVRQAQMGWG
jgi:hypothetical protein